MRKYYVIFLIDEDKYLLATGNPAKEEDLTDEISRAGKWPTEESAENWLAGNTSDIKSIWFIIYPVWRKA